jgi:hypothetical protein
MISEIATLIRVEALISLGRDKPGRQQRASLRVTADRSRRLDGYSVVQDNLHDPSSPDASYRNRQTS